MQIDACDGMTAEAAGAHLTSPHVAEAMSSLQPVYVKSKGQCVVYVPVVAWQKPVGLLGIVAPKCTR
jgi:hypothetical protein